MRLREFFFGTIVMTLALITGNANPVTAFIPEVDPEMDADRQTASSAAVIMPLAPSTVIANDKVLESAYYDTLTILSVSNTCSDFFGGPVIAVDVFAKFMQTVKKDHLAPAIAMRMSGQTTSVFNTATKAEYRLFDKASLNSNGPFYRRAVSRADVSVPHVGKYAPNTEKVRVLILLHELGHVMTDRDGKWVLPDDGNNETLSRENSRKIEEVCGDQIQKLGENEGMKNLARQKLAEEKVALQRSSVSQPQ